jgi:hypothetical protein
LGAEQFAREVRGRRNNPTGDILKRAATVILATVALMSVVFVAGAAGHRIKYPSTVAAKFDKHTTAFDGSVASAKRGCVTDRTVNLKLRATDGSTPVVGTAVTDSTGAWVIQPTSAPVAGTYFATAAKKVLRKNSKHRHVCSRAVSKDVKVK